VSFSAHSVTIPVIQIALQMQIFSQAKATAVVEKKNKNLFHRKTTKSRQANGRLIVSNMLLLLFIPQPMVSGVLNKDVKNLIDHVTT